MNLHEYQAKELLRKFGVAVPDGTVAYDVNGAVEVADELGGKKWVVKAQVHAGGRGKAGGVKIVDSKDAIREAVKALLGTRLV
ncbi:MAG: succinate--CoA ligase subunit beta, partial [Coxiella sp. (in: Bacteria)]